MMILLKEEDEGFLAPERDHEITAGETYSKLQRLFLGHFI
jgi:hypothetical protein